MWLNHIWYVQTLGLDSQRLSVGMKAACRGKTITPRKRASVLPEPTSSHKAPLPPRSSVRSFSL
jgi:hypothetical protein